MMRQQRFCLPPPLTWAPVAITLVAVIGTSPGLVLCVGHDGQIKVKSITHLCHQHAVVLHEIHDAADNGAAPSVGPVHSCSACTDFPLAPPAWLVAAGGESPLLFTPSPATAVATAEQSLPAAIDDAVLKLLHRQRSVVLLI